MIKPKFYKQCAPKWQVYSWNDATVCRNGCGPSAIANAVAVLPKLGHKKATPLSVFKWVCGHGYMHPTHGTYYSGITATLKAYGVKKVIHTSSMTALKRHLKKGDFCICLTGQSRWTRSGHYILAYGMDNQGKVYISDSASSDPSRAKADFSILKAAIKAHPYPQVWIIDNTAQYLNKKTPVKKPAKKKDEVIVHKAKYEVVSKIGSNIRKGHNVNTKKIGAVPCGTIVKTTHKYKDWVKCRKGWICIKDKNGTYLKKK